MHGRSAVIQHMGTVVRPFLTIQFEWVWQAYGTTAGWTLLLDTFDGWIVCCTLIFSENTKHFLLIQAQLRTDAPQLFFLTSQCIHSWMTFFAVYAACRLGNIRWRKNRWELSKKSQITIKFPMGVRWCLSFDQISDWKIWNVVCSSFRCSEHSFRICFIESSHCRLQMAKCQSVLAFAHFFL